MTTDNKKRIYIASDHNGNAMRAHIVRMWKDVYDVIDLGPFEYHGKVNYIEYALGLCELVKMNDARGILICGTGTGMSIVANRFEGIRAALVTDMATSYLAREHNDANVLVLGQWRTPIGDTDDIVEAFMETECTEQRHLDRLDMLKKLGGLRV